MSQPVVRNRKDRRRLKVLLTRGLDATMTARQCGECSACCTPLEIPEIDKACNVTCQHVAAGCSIYPTRPKACRDYQCGWRLGFGLLDERPDRMGILLTPTRPGMPAHPALLIHELWPDAFFEAQAFLIGIAERIVLILIRDGLAKKFMGPEDKILALRSVIDGAIKVNAAAREGLNRCLTTVII